MCKVSLLLLMKSSHFIVIFDFIYIFYFTDYTNLTDFLTLFFENNK